MIKIRISNFAYRYIYNLFANRHLVSYRPFLNASQNQRSHILPPPLLYMIIMFDATVHRLRQFPWKEQISIRWRRNSRESKCNNNFLIKNWKLYDTYLYTSPLFIGTWTIVVCTIAPCRCCQLDRATFWLAAIVSR